MTTPRLPLRLLAAGALAVTAALPLAVPASAGDDILVTSQSAMAAWQADVTRDLNQRLAIAETRTGARARSGIVQVRFRLDADGRATGLETHTNTAGHHAARVARWAVRNLDNLGDAPVRNAGGVRFQANIIFADDAAQKDRLAADLRRMERARLAAVGGERLVSLGN